MHKKRALQAAVAGVLSLGITVAQAGELKMIPFTGVSNIDNEPAISASDLTYAYEQFDETRTVAKTPLAYPFRTIYKFADNVNSLTSDFYVTMTLSEGAAWETDLQQPDKFRLVKNDGTPTVVSSARSAGGEVGQSSVTYLVMASRVQGGISKDDRLDFNFKIRADKPLSAPGGQVQLTVQINLATGSDFTSGKIIDVPRTIPIAASAEAMTIGITGGGQQTTGTGFISVEENSLKFTGTAIKDNGLRIDYGTITLMPAGGSGLLSVRAVNTLIKGGELWNPVNDFDRGILTIKDGNFNASGATSDKNVYVEVPAPTLKVPATLIDLNERKAEWELTAADLTNIYGTNPRTMYLVVNGTTAIEEFRQLETVGTFQVKMKTRTNFIQVSSKLRHLKKNGTVCNLYIIPDQGALDNLNIRFTNDSATTTGFVKGSLRKMSGEYVYKGRELVTDLTPNKTVRLDNDDISNKGEFKWTERGVLTIESNIPDGKLQVYLLLRAKSSGGGPGFAETPLLNMSPGATGNSCD